MKVTICSDSHGAFAAAEQVLEQQPEAAAVISGATCMIFIRKFPFTRCGATATGEATGRRNG